MKEVIGIDLGTTYSAAAYLNDGQPVMIDLGEGEESIPSVVSFFNGEPIVGEKALQQENAMNAVRRIKRSMGTEYKIEIEQREYSPEEISAFILKEIKRRAEKALGSEIKDVVITVPAYFNDNQRQSTKNAGRIAGLNVMRIINEPTAASLSYGINADEDMIVVVYDLGGGTFDVSVLNVGEGVFEVMSTAGDNQLGGEDFNRRIEELVIEKFKEETNIDISGDPLAALKITEGVEKCKRELSEKKSARLHVPFIAADEEKIHDVDFMLSRGEFENLIQDYIDRTIELTKQAVQDAEIQLGEVDRVVLVGGSSRIPKVRSEVEKLFGLKIEDGHDPELVVAQGAAIQAGIVHGQVSDVVLVDVTPMSLGIEVEDGYFVPIIERNTPIPTSAKRLFTNVGDNQQRVDVHVLQGESMHSKNNVSLGKFQLENIRRCRKGEARIEVNFELDVNGILKVSAMDKDVQTERGITIKNTAQLDDDKIKKMIEKHEKAYQSEIENRSRLTELLRLKTRAEFLADNITRLIPVAYRDSMLADEVKNAMKKVSKAVDKLDLETVQACVSDLEYSLGELRTGNFMLSEK